MEENLAKGQMTGMSPHGKVFPNRQDAQSTWEETDPAGPQEGARSQAPAGFPPVHEGSVFYQRAISGRLLLKGRHSVQAQETVPAHC